MELQAETAVTSLESAPRVEDDSTEAPVDPGKEVGQSDVRVEAEGIDKEAQENVDPLSLEKELPKYESGAVQNVTEASGVIVLTEKDLPKCDSGIVQNVTEASRVVANGSPAPGVSEDESTEDDSIKAAEVPEKKVEAPPTPVIDTTTSKVKDQKKLTKKESKSKNKSRESGKSKDKKKEDKSIEHVLKALSSLSSPEEKLAALCKKYTELLDEHKVMQAGSKQSQKQLTGLMREKESLQNDHSKSLLAKSKMENLCRELQKHNKLIKEESLARVKDEEEKRREVANRFQTTITDIQSQMQENYSKNTKLREENIELATRLKDLVANYEKAQHQVEKVFGQNLVLTQEKEKDCKEKQMLFLELEQSQKKIELMQCNEQQLRSQLALYTEKYEDFQSTLQKSNDVFNTFKGEMDKMTKKIKKLEKETILWKGRCDNSSKALVEMAEEKTKRDQETIKLNTKIQKLEKLCRALQAERNLLKSESDRGSSSRGASPSDSTKESSPVPDVVKDTGATPEGAMRSSLTPGGGAEEQAVVKGTKAEAEQPVEEVSSADQTDGVNRTVDKIENEIRTEPEQTGLSDDTKTTDSSCIDSNQTQDSVDTETKPSESVECIGATSVDSIQEASPTDVQNESEGSVSDVD